MSDVLHVALNADTNKLFIWVETRKLRKLHVDANSIPRHPFASHRPMESLRHVGDVRQNKQTIVYLPSLDLPQPSPELIAQVVSTQAQIKPWRLTALSGELHNLYKLLLLPRDELEEAELVPSRAWLWYSELARWLQTIIERGLFLPHLYTDPSGSLRASWHFTAEEEECLRRFCQQAPWSALACTDPVLAGLMPLDVHLTNFATFFLKKLIYHEVLSQQYYYHSVYHVLMKGVQGVVRRWAEALCVRDGSLDARVGHVDAVRLLTAYSAWTDEYRRRQAEPYSLQVRLVEADDEQPWRLTLLLQDRRDPQRLIPVDELTSLMKPQERLEAQKNLQKIIERLSSAEPILSRAWPARPYVLLSQEEVIEFLRSGVARLEGRGVTVLLPDWMRLGQTQVRARARILSEGDESSGMLGLDKLLRIETQVMLGDQVIDRRAYEELVALKQSLLRVNGRWIMVDPEQLERGLRYFEQDRPMSVAESLRLGLTESGQLGEVFVESVTAEGWFANVLQRLRQTETLQEVPPPADLQAEMRPYQKRGLAWLSFLYQYRLGACLADDMGLGKTVQAIAFLLHLRQQGQLRTPSLVIAPTSVVMNWKRELARFAPTLKTLIHQGKDRLLKDAFRQAAQQAEVVVSSYALLSRDRETLSPIPWSVLILDEAHNIKNSSTKQAQVARSLAADYRVAMTGTPIENRLAELWSIFHFLNSGYLGSEKTFQAQFARPIERHQDEDAIQQLRRLTSPFILRRMKTDPNIIQDLPDKIETRVYATLTIEQASLYEAVVRDTMAAIERAQGQMARRGLILRLLVQLKQVCNHPAHFLKDGSELKGRSGKLERLCDLLEEIEETNEGDKVLIFTQFAEMGELLRQHLAAVFKTEPLWLHGADTPKKREAAIQRFRDDPQARLFILSLRAGGVGLNLVEANHVFHYDRWWNPAVEDQATDRAFRIGQKRTVQVHKFVCSGTLEERIDDLIENKKGLAEQVVGSDESWLTELSSAELRDLVRLRLLGD
ncbi:MAG: DEAD/DEAH box helicase [Anaerolineae bacterium]|nr:DEAD/DEAH box helicase [Anaerolineae bacterium]MDW8173668.1 DEAD/DEAH box helicase [Anaerolineae bacterium]